MNNFTTPKMTQDLGDHSPLLRNFETEFVQGAIQELHDDFVKFFDEGSNTEDGWAPRLTFLSKDTQLMRIRLRSPDDEDDVVNALTEAASLAVHTQTKSFLYAYDSYAEIEGKQTDAFIVIYCDHTGIGAQLKAYSLGDDGKVVWQDPPKGLDSQDTRAGMKLAFEYIELRHAFTLAGFINSARHNHRSQDLQIMLGLLQKSGHEVELIDGDIGSLIELKSGHGE